MTDGMRFRILGPVEVRPDGRWIGVGPAKWRALLAVLLINANQVVSVNRLLDELWGEHPPASGAKPLQLYVARLRGLLGADLGARLATRPQGYTLTVRPGELDAEVFRERVGTARQLLGNGAAEQAGGVLEGALALWRGPALADVPAGGAARVETARLDAARMSALEARFAARLACGQHEDVLPELEALVAEDPLQEGLCRYLMLALGRSGRRAAALAAYRRTVAALARDLSLAPSAALRDMERAVRSGDPSLDWRADPAPGTPRAPMNLPAGTPSLVGRAAELHEILHRVGSPQGAATVVCAIHGPGGIGKSALAVSAAHRLAPRFPDGCLYADLHGAGTGVHRLEPLEVLGRFLRLLGVHGTRVPADTDEAAALFRSLLADRRTLVVLDDADSAAQVRPLLPSGPANAVLLTSRRILSSLDTSLQVGLGPLPLVDAVDLLALRAGNDLVTREPDAAATVAGHCDGFPLALRIAGARLAARAGWSLREFARLLADDRRRLDELRVDDLAVRASLGSSYRGLLGGGARAGAAGAAAASVFRLLGLVDCPDVGVEACAALAGRPGDEVEEDLEHLVDLHLLESPARGRYRMHGLLRLYARERAGEEDSRADRLAAVGRLAQWYEDAVRAACRVLHLEPAPAGGTAPEPPHAVATIAGAQAWLAAEETNVRIVIRRALDAGQVPPALLRLAAPLSRFLDVWGHRHALCELGDLTLRAARSCGDRTAEADASNMLGTASMRVGDLHSAETHFLHSLDVRRASGEPAAEAVALNNLGMLYRRIGEFAAAMDCLGRCLRIRRELGDAARQVSTLDNVGLVYQSMRRYDEAIEHHEAALALADRTGDRHRAGLILLNLGATLCHAGRPAESLPHLGRALGICRDFDHHLGEGAALQWLGNAHDACGDRGLGQQYWEQALCIFERLGIGEAEEVRVRLRTAP